MYEGKFPHKRYKHTLLFLKEYIPIPSNVLDLGVVNPFSEIMLENGYRVTNTKGEDLDLDTLKQGPTEYITDDEFIPIKHAIRLQ